MPAPVLVRGLAVVLFWMMELTVSWSEEPATRMTISPPEEVGCNRGVVPPPSVTFVPPLASRPLACNTGEVPFIVMLNAPMLIVLTTAEPWVVMAPVIFTSEAEVTLPMFAPPATEDAFVSVTAV